jgi:hypothetical protein
MFLKFAANYYATIVLFAAVERCRALPLNLSLQLSIVAVNTLYAKLSASLLSGTRRKDFNISCLFFVLSGFWFRECEEIEGGLFDTYTTLTSRLAFRLGSI